MEVLNALLKIDISINDLGEAQRTWEQLRMLSSTERLKAWQPVMDKVEALRNNDQPVPMSAQIENGSNC